MWSALLMAAVVAPAGGSSWVPSNAPNLNGAYRLSGSKATKIPWAESYAKWPGGAMMFDAYSPPFETLYSQVWWAGLPPLPLPEHVIKQFEGGKIMAIVGFEIDQVIRGAGLNGTDLSVPINAAYNHHFDGTLNNGKKSRLVRLEDGDPRLAELGHRGHGVASGPYRPVEHTAGVPLKSGGNAPTSLQLGGGNGGEYRKTYHGYAPGHAQIIESPTEIQITPMQIDTWNRDAMDLHAPNPPKFVPGPLPRSSLSPASGSDATYSGLLECPLTTRISKDIESDYTLLGAGGCPAHGTIGTAAECWSAAVKALGTRLAAGATKTVVTPGSPRARASPTGCSVTVAAGAARSTVEAGRVEIVFNTAEAGGGGAVECGAGTAALVGGVGSFVNVSVSLDIQQAEATITMAGPSSTWFGVGFGEAMKGAYAIVVDGAGAVTERALGDHVVGRLLAPSITAKTVTVSKSGVRTVVLTRPMRGAAAEYFSFPAAAVVLPLIDAVGTGPDLAYHKDKTATSAALLPVGGPGVGGACVCAAHPLPFGQGKGTLVYTPVEGDEGERGKPTALTFSNRCAPQPRGDLFVQRNPTCDVRTYTGGQSACHHMFSLLDADQPVPWPDQPINYTLKWRFWYQEFDPSVHSTIQYSHLGAGTDWSIGAGNVGAGYGSEYDVPKCGEGVPGCALESDGTWVHTITGTFKVSNGRQFAPTKGKILPVVAHLHCHAPTCLSMAVHNNATGELLCLETAIYGGTNMVDEKRFDEPGYIAVPPCVWGLPMDGLEPSPDISNVTLYVVKRANATYGHHGEMAHGEIYYVDTPRGG